jgi:hypothetical protein
VSDRCVKGPLRGNLEGMPRESIPTPAPGPRRAPPPPRRPSAPPAAGAPDPHPNPWQGLIVLGKERGYLTVEDVLAVFDIINRAPPLDLQPVYDHFADMGVDIVHDGDVERFQVPSTAQLKSEWLTRRK